MQMSYLDYQYIVVCLHFQKNKYFNPARSKQTLLVSFVKKKTAVDVVTYQKIPDARRRPTGWSKPVLMHVHIGTKSCLGWMEGHWVVSWILWV